MAKSRLVLVSSVLAVRALAAGSQTADLDDGLKRPLSPGAVVLLLEHARDERARERIAGGLRDPRPEVRAAAARVAHASAIGELVPDLVAALATETEPWPATELIRAVANLGDATSDPVLLAAARRLRLGAVAGPALAAGRGSRGLEHLAILRQMEPLLPLAATLKLATRGNPESLGPLVSAAMREGDSALWRAYLEIQRDRDQAPASGFVLVSLSLPALRPETLWHLAVAEERRA